MDRTARPEILGIQRCSLDLQFARFSAPEVPERVRYVDSKSGASRIFFWRSGLVVPSGSRKCQAGTWEVSGGQGKPCAPELWPESSRRGLNDQFQVETCSCQVSSFSVAPGDL